MASQNGTLVRKPAAFGGEEVKFGKSDKILKIPTGPAERPSGILFLGRDGSHFHADISRYPANIAEIMRFHGAKQKLGDEYADLDSIEDSLEAVRELDERLAAGRWTAERTGFVGMSLLLRAIMEVFGLDETAAREFLKPLTQQEKQGLKHSPELKPVIDRMESERAKQVDVGGLIGKLKQGAAA